MIWSHFEDCLSFSFYISIQAPFPSLPGPPPQVKIQSTRIDALQFGNLTSCLWTLSLTHFMRNWTLIFLLNFSQVPYPPAYSPTYSNMAPGAPEKHPLAPYPGASPAGPPPYPTWSGDYWSYSHLSLQWTLIDWKHFCFGFTFLLDPLLRGESLPSFIYESWTTLL